MQEEKFRVARPSPESVQAIRRSVATSTLAFQRRFGIPSATITNWEQGRRKPDPAAALLLRMIDAHPELVEQVARENAIAAELAGEAS